MEASVILMKCQSTSLLNGVRVQKMEDGDWRRTWAFPIKEGNAINEGYGNTQIVGSLYIEEGYCGCSYCGRMNFVKCGSCKKLTCYTRESSVTCGWCGVEMSNIRENNSFDVTGGSM